MSCSSDQTPTSKQKQKEISINEFRTIVNNFETTQTTLDDTVNVLDGTLTAQDPKKGRWLLETGEDIDMLDAIAAQCEDKVNRPRGQFSWNSMMENLTNKYIKPEIDENTYREKEYIALKVMDQWYIDNKKLYMPNFTTDDAICKTTDTSNQTPLQDDTKSSVPTERNTDANIEL